MAISSSAFAEDRQPNRGIEVQEAAAPLEVLFPLPDSTFHEPPSFSGFGQASAVITITVNGVPVGETTNPGGIGDGETVPWSIDVPEESLPAEGTFDAVVTQVFGADVQTVTVTGLSADVFGGLVLDPFPGDEVDGDVVFSGEAFADGQIGLVLDGTTDEGVEVNKVAISETAPAGSAAALAEEADPEEWAGEFTIEDGDDRRTWSFDPSDALEIGDYTISIGILVTEEEVDMGNAVDFRVASEGTGDDAGDAGGTETGGDESGTETGGDESGTETGGDESGTETGGDESGDDAGTEAGGAESGADNGTDDGAESGSDDGADAGAESGDDNGTESGAESGSDDGAESGDDDLPDTGSSSVPFVLAGLALLLGGAALVVIRAQRATV